MSQREEPSFGALIGAVLAAVDGMVIGGTVCPGLLLCVPGILLVVAPIVALGLLVLVAVGLPVALVVTVTFAARLVARQVRRIPAPRARVAAAERQPAGLVVLTGRSADRHA